MGKRVGISTSFYNKRRPVAVNVINIPGSRGVLDVEPPSDFANVESGTGAIDVCIGVGRKQPMVLAGFRITEPASIVVRAADTNKERKVVSIRQKVGISRSHFFSGGVQVRKLGGSAAPALPITL